MRLNYLYAAFVVTVTTLIGTGCGEDFRESYDKASSYYEQKKYEEAEPLLRKAADHGYVAAQWKLGVMYGEGLGVEQDEREAAKWYLKAANEYNTHAQTKIGHMYEEGRGVNQDYTTAAMWYRRAAKQGDVDAQMRIAYMYDKGLGVVQSDEEARRWYNRAAALGNAVAQNRLGDKYETLGDYAEAEKWYRAAADQGDAVAKDYLDRVTKEREREENAFGVAGVKLGMNVSQVERRLGKFNLVAPEKALAKLISGGLVSMESIDPEYVDAVYVAVNPTTGAGLMGSTPGIDKKTGQFQWNQSVFEKGGFKILSLKFTRKELGPKLLSMDVSREFGAQPDWNMVEQKLVDKYGKPDRTDINLSKRLSEFSNGNAKKQYLWGECKNINKGLDMSKCEGAALLVSFEEGKALFSGKYKAGVMMQFVDGKLAKENEIAIQKAKQAKKQAKETKTASQVDGLNF